MLGLDRALGFGDERVPAVALGEHPLGAALRRLPQLARRSEPRPAGAGHRRAGETARKRLEVVYNPAVLEQPARQRDNRLWPTDQLRERDCSRHRRRLGRARLAARTSDQRAAAIAARPVQQRAAGAQVIHDRRAQAAAERRGERELVSGLHLELVRQRPHARREATAPRMASQELVRRRELRTDARRLAPGGLGRVLGRPPRLPRGLARLVGLAQRLAAALALAGEIGGPRGGRVPLRAERLQLALQRLRALGIQPLQLGLQHLDALPAGLVGRVLGGLRAQRGELVLALIRPLGDVLGGLARAVQPQLEPLGGRAGAVRALRELLALLGAPRQRLLGRLALGAHRRELGLRLVARRTRGCGRGLRLLELGSASARRVPRQLPLRLDGLALQALVQLGRLGLALQRPQARAGLPLDVQRAIEVVLRALELELRAPASLAVLAKPRGLLDQQAPVPRLRCDDRLDAALRDDRVHLLA